MFFESGEEPTQEQKKCKVVVMDFVIKHQVRADIEDLHPSLLPDDVEITSEKQLHEVLSNEAGGC